MKSAPRRRVASLPREPRPDSTPTVANTYGPYLHDENDDDSKYYYWDSTCKTQYRGAIDELRHVTKPRYFQSREAAEAAGFLYKACPDTLASP